MRDARIRRLRLSVLALAMLAVSLTACDSRSGVQVTTVDLLKMAPRAERRPAAAPVPVVDHSCGTAARASLQVPVPSRVIFTLNFPARARLVIAAALEGGADATAEFRVGISDRRTYETLLATRVPASACPGGWADFVIDLSRYGGRQWSLFYRPDERTWELIFGVGVPEGAPTKAFWGLPRIESDIRAARKYLRPAG